jgi:cell division initiation protein
MRIEPVEVQHVKLKRRFRGYDRGAVDQLLEDVTASYEEVWLERDELQAEVRQLREEIERSGERERLIGDALVRAQKIAEATVAEARSTAARLVHEAEEKAEAVLKEAHAEPVRAQEQLRRLQAAESGIRARLREFLTEAERLLDEESAVEAPLARLEPPEKPMVAAAGGSGPLG